MRILFFLLVVKAMAWMPNYAQAKQSAAVALQGVVTSDAEGRMEGALVSAKRSGSTVAVTVVSNAQGVYTFPKSRLQPGKYRLTVRAAGYDVDNPRLVEVVVNKTAEANLKLNKTKDLTSQLSNAEWILSIPGITEQKKQLDCVGCHTLERVIISRHNATAWLDVLHRMANYASSSCSLRASKLPFDVPKNPNDVPLAEYLSSINLGSASKLKHSLKTLPRPTGRATKVVITEYDLPRKDSQPHDAVVDSQGMIWYNDFGLPYIGKLNPKTGEVLEYSVPEVKSGFIRGATDIEIDKEGNPWIRMLFQAAIGKFDTKTKKFTTWSIPSGFTDNHSRAGMLALPHDGQDTRVWFSDNTNLRMHRLDALTGKIDTFPAFPKVRNSADEYARGSGRRYSIYGIAVDSHNNGYFSNIQGGQIGKVDAKTGRVTLYSTPTPDAGPRRIYIDFQDRLWFAEYRAHKLGMFDTQSEQFQEWSIPTPWSAPYDVVVDKNGEVWGGGMWTDRIFRFNPQTAQFTEYLLPRSANIRRVDVDDSTTPVTFWAGNNHGASMVKLEPVEEQLENSDKAASRRRAEDTFFKTQPAK